MKAPKRWIEFASLAEVYEIEMYPGCKDFGDVYFIIFQQKEYIMKQFR